MTTEGTLRALSDLLATAADSIAKFGDSIAHIVSLGTQAYDEVSARRVRVRVKDISARLVNVHRVSNASIYSGIEGYIAKARQHHASLVSNESSNPKSLQTSWSEFVRVLPIPLEQISELLGDVSRERSDLVLENSYGEVLAALNSRVRIIQDLMNLPPPTTPQEIEALEQVLSQYDRLRRDLGRASAALADYLKGAA